MPTFLRGIDLPFAWVSYLNPLR